MSIEGYRWLMTAVNAPLEQAAFRPEPGPGEVVVAIAGCGVCHTDLGYLYDGVRTNHPLPLALGHEISGRVVAAGAGAESWIGKAVIVPAVLPCGECDLCKRGLGTICREQKMPGNDIQGGFALAHCGARARAVRGRRSAPGVGGTRARRGVDRRRRADHALSGSQPRRCKTRAASPSWSARAASAATACRSPSLRRQGRRDRRR